MKSSLHIYGMKEKKLTIRKDFFKKKKYKKQINSMIQVSFLNWFLKAKYSIFSFLPEVKKKKKTCKEYSKTCNLGIGLTLKFVQMYVKETAEKFSAKPRRVSEMNSDIWSVE